MSKYPRNKKCWCGSGIKYKKCCFPELNNGDDIIIRNINSGNKGTQPIRVLFSNMINYFEKTHKDFLKKLEFDTNQKELKKGIKLLNEESKLGNIAYINSNKQIHIQETFLSYIWIFSFCIVDLFDNHIQLPRIKNNSKSDINELKKTFDFFKYGLSLIDRFSDWDIEKFPNPYKYKKELKIKIEKINSVFLHATNWILCHEYSHFSLGHTEKSIMAMVKGKEISDIENKKDEIEADKNAINLLLKEWKTKKIKKNIEYGIITGISSLLFLDTITEKKKYPDPEIRLKTALEQMKIKDTDLHWGLASLALKLWVDKEGEILSLPPIMDTYKEIFYQIIEEIRKIKE